MEYIHTTLRFQDSSIGIKLQLVTFITSTKPLQEKKTRCGGPVQLFSKVIGDISQDIILLHIQATIGLDGH